FLAPGAGDQTAGVCADGAQFALLRLLQPLSLGAGLSLTYALSSAYQYPLSGGGQRVKKKTSLLHGQQVLQEADRLVQRIAEGERIELRVGQRTVTVAL